MLSSRNPGVWRTARTGALPTFEYFGNPVAKPVDGRLDKSLVTVKNGQRRKRFIQEKPEPLKYIRPKHRHGRKSA
jgi:hypothetical protein